MKMSRGTRNLAAASLRAGQFQNRVIPDKKKTARKNSCRVNILRFQRAENGPLKGPFSLSINDLVII